MSQQLREKITKFSDFFKQAGLKEKNFIVPKTGTWAEKAAMQHTRIKVAELVLNEGKTINKADTSTWRYTPYFRIIKDESALAGLRLSFDGYDIDGDSAYSGLDARPEFFESADATFLGTEFLKECELLMQYQVMAETELLEKLKQK